MVGTIAVHFRRRGRHSLLIHEGDIDLKQAFTASLVLTILRSAPPVTDVVNYRGEVGKASGCSPPTTRLPLDGTCSGLERIRGTVSSCRSIFACPISTGEDASRFEAAASRITDEEPAFVTSCWLALQGSGSLQKSGRSGETCQSGAIVASLVTNDSMSLFPRVIWAAARSPSPASKRFRISKSELSDAVSSPV